MAMPKQSLLEKAKAKSSSQRTVIGHEEIALALAWARDEVTLTQVAFALGHERAASEVYSCLSRALREAIRRKELS